jgi:molybdopterin synthase catalytic subunit
MATADPEVVITKDVLEWPGPFLKEDSGAVVEFWGVVRDKEEGRALEGIDYEVHRAMAQHQMEELAQTAVKEFSLTHLCLWHRVGFVRLAEASLFLRVAADHRAKAFGASQWLISELKARVPIWKRPIFTPSPKARSVGAGSPGV